MTHLKLQNVTCKHRLHVPHLDLNSGMYGLIGPNGAGKTTLLRAVAGFLPIKGNIDASSVAIARTGADILLSGSTVAQHLRAAEHVREGFDVGYAEELLDKMGVDKRSKNRSLSTGQRQLVACATALAARTPVTLLDEPFNGLDAPTRTRLRELIIAHAAATPDWLLLLSSHRAEDLVGLIDQVITVQEGTVNGPTDLESQRPHYPVLTGSVKDVEQALTLADALPLHHSSLGSTSKVHAWCPAPFPADTAAAAHVTVSYLDDGQLIDSLVSHAHESARTRQEES
ncbi:MULTISPECIES: ATP-binding cassette domain-containing protein [Corynebacterium]|uniref:ATP-binding cassette domain-containing protein n=1 Tax=Corynebacterium TaxID=1716 RepID=UPI001EF35B21|nr:MULTISPECIES: ATP-binding cassette domain-containing protein [Corynebacterium]MCG7460602.1 ATP-binding cassette domain-containing protein [Corynebacterium sp. ACRPF]MCG7466874.1 ATP-binding cassette domain-containing protein [Corynebacterium sp. ACRPE]MDV2418004.1 ATP-binding cassette domain-containing protein [Corynebacterium tuberculostearicum]